jgi:hypothetical protein
MAKDDFPGAIQPNGYGVAQAAADEHYGFAAREAESIPTIEPRARIQAVFPRKQIHLTSVKMAGKNEVVCGRTNFCERAGIVGAQDGDFRVRRLANDLSAGDDTGGARPKGQRLVFEADSTGLPHGVLHKIEADAPVVIAASGSHQASAPGGRNQAAQGEKSGFFVHQIAAEEKQIGFCGNDDSIQLSDKPPGFMPHQMQIAHVEYAKRSIEMRQFDRFPADLRRRRRADFKFPGKMHGIPFT